MIFSRRSKRARIGSRTSRRTSRARSKYNKSILSGFFGRRPRARNKRQVRDLQKHITLGIVVLAFIFVPIAIATWLITEKSNELACSPGSIPDRHLVVLIDGSQTLTRVQKRIFEKYVISYDGLNRDQLENEFGKQVPAGTQVSIYKMELGNVNAPAPLFDECRRPMGSDFFWYDHLIRGEIVADLEFQAIFFDKLQRALEKNISGGRSKGSPILETIKNISTPSQFNGRPVELVLFSDLEQNTHSFSVYKTCSQQTAYTRTEPPVCPPEPRKLPCTVARECKKTIPTCTTSICAEVDLCGEKPLCGNPVSTCYGVDISGPNPTPDCSCNYALGMKRYQAQCDVKTQNCQVRARENLEQCLSKRSTLLAECADDQEATRAQCREEERNYQADVREHRDRCRSDLRDWKKSEDARKENENRKSCGWPREEAFEGYMTNHESHWSRVNPGRSVFEKIKFVHLRNYAPKPAILEDWVENFWRGYAEKIGASNIEYIREE
jgi:hypothetical protein